MKLQILALTAGTVVADFVDHAIGEEDGGPLDCPSLTESRDRRGDGSKNHRRRCGGGSLFGQELRCGDHRVLHFVAYRVCSAGVGGLDRLSGFATAGGRSDLEGTLSRAWHISRGWRGGRGPSRL